MAKRRCKDGCDWQPLPRSFYERCLVCRDTFPCRFGCGHVDCIETRIANARVLPGDHARRDQAVMTRWPVKGLPVFTTAAPAPEPEPQDEEPGRYG